MKDYRKPNEHIIQNIFLKIMELALKIWLILPIIPGILFPMFYMVPIIFSSWYLFSPNFTYESWITQYAVFSNLICAIMLGIGLVIGFFGLSLLAYGVWILAKTRLKKEHLAKKGPYRYIRHPQNLGILLMCVPFNLAPWIRFGQIQSWILIIAIVALTSLLEEHRMMKKMRDEYLEYISETGFFLPKFKILNQKTIVAKNYFLTSIGKILLFFMGATFLHYLLYLVLNYTGYVYSIRQLFG